MVPDPWCGEGSSEEVVDAFSGYLKSKWYIVGALLQWGRGDLRGTRRVGGDGVLLYLRAGGGCAVLGDLLCFSAVVGCERERGCMCVCTADWSAFDVLFTLKGCRTCGGMVVVSGLLCCFTGGLTVKVGMDLLLFRLVRGAVQITFVFWSGSGRVWKRVLRGSCC